MTPIYVGGDPHHDGYAVATLEQFSERIKGRRDWNDWHTRSTWSGSHLSARLGDFRSARRQLKRAWASLRYNGLERELVAATLDRCQLMCRGFELRGDSPEKARKLIQVCLDRPSLPEPLEERLKVMHHVLEHRPEDAFPLKKTLP